MKKVKTMEMDLIRSRALTVLLSMLLSALLLLPLFTSAKGGEKIMSKAKVYMQPLNKDAHATVTIASIGEGKYTLIIESEDGNSVYYDEILKSPEKFSKIFNFSNLENGSYTLKIKSKNEEKTRNFTLNNGKIKVFYKEVEDSPAFNTRGDKASLSISNASQLNYSIRIANHKGEELYQTYESKENIKKVFDFSDVEPGKYQIQAASNTTTYTFDYQKKNQ